MLKYFCYVFTISLFVACTSDRSDAVTKIKKDSLLVQPAANVDFKVDTIPVHNVFDEEQFENNVLVSLLAELKICETDQTKPFRIEHPPCEPRFYKLFKYNYNMDWKEGFALEIRAGVENFPLRRFIIFKRINGKLTKLNGFVANLVEIQTQPSGFNDLLLLFRDTEAGSFVVKYTWKKENYTFMSLEAVDGYAVKPALKDSLSRVVEKRLEQNKMFF